MFVYASRKNHALLRQIYVGYTLALHNYKLRKIHVNKECKALPTKIKPRIRCDRQRMYHNIHVPLIFINSISANLT